MGIPWPPEVGRHRVVGTIDRYSDLALRLADHSVLMTTEQVRELVHTVSYTAPQTATITFVIDQWIKGRPRRTPAI